MVRWGWDSGGGHMLVIRGYTSDPGYLVVSYIDPLQSYYSSGTYDWMKAEVVIHGRTHDMALADKGGTNEYIL